MLGVECRWGAFLARKYVFDRDASPPCADDASMPCSGSLWSTLLRSVVVAKTLEIGRPLSLKLSQGSHSAKKKVVFERVQRRDSIEVLCSSLPATKSLEP